MAISSPLPAPGSFELDPLILVVFEVPVFFASPFSLEPPVHFFVGIFFFPSALSVSELPFFDTDQ